MVSHQGTTRMATMTDETPTGGPTSPRSEPTIPAGGESDAPGSDLPTIPPIVPQTPVPEGGEPITAETVGGDPTAPGPTVRAGAAPGSPVADPAWTPPPSGASRRVGVPLWVLLGLGGLLLLALGFLGGWAVG